MKPAKRFCIARVDGDCLKTGTMSACVTRESAQAHLDIYAKHHPNNGYALYELIPVFHEETK